jgi:hypothetical protein
MDKMNSFFCVCSETYGVKDIPLGVFYKDSVTPCPSFFERTKSSLAWCMRGACEEEKPGDKAGGVRCRESCHGAVGCRDEGWRSCVASQP